VTMSTATCLTKSNEPETVDFQQTGNVSVTKSKVSEIKSTVSAIKSKISTTDLSTLSPILVTLALSPVYTGLYADVTI